MAKTKVSIIGGAGYGAGEILRHLVTRESVEIVRIASKDHIGKTVGEVHRGLAGFCDVVLEDIGPKEATKGCDFVFLCMPHKTTAKVAMEILDDDVRIIDLSGDFRLEDIEDYKRDYAPEHPCPERLGTFTYGLPELFRDEIKKAKHVSSPGCFATTIALGLLPLAKAGFLSGANVRTVAMTGSSGSGQKPSAGTHHPVRHENLKAYKMLNHQHRPEVVQTLKNAGADKMSLDFIPVSAPLSRGILAISQLDLPKGQSGESLDALYREYYASHRLIRMRDLGVSPDVAAVARTARVEVGLAVREDALTGQKTLACVSAIDNLIKGGAGQALQSFNIMSGEDEFKGLDVPGFWP